MKSGDILHVTWSTPSLVIYSGSPLRNEASLLQSGTRDAFTITAPAPTLKIDSNLVCQSRQSNRAHRYRWVTSGSSAFAAPTPTGTISAPSEAPGDPSVNISTPPATAPPPKLPKAEKIELAIDSLSNYELIKPIPVLIESLGDKVFLAEAPDLNLSTTGSSVGAAFLLLKEQIIATYEGHRSKKGLDAERTRQLAALDQHIGKPRRHWF
jgi:hypothetical protein